MTRSSDSLAKYRAKRDFRSTPEPKGRVSKREGHRYSIQKHDASRLHYDFRLELNGVLKSWAMPKGPSLDTSKRRLAVMTEDHPIEYGDFEGVIEKGYGAGTVMLWDRGTWTPQEDAEEGLKQGHLKLVLHGERLQGGFALIRMQKDNWLLVKEHDEHASGDVDPVSQWRDSVATGRDMRAIAQPEETVICGVALTHPDKVMFDAQNVTKRVIAEYYARHAQRILPFIKGRPVSLLRCPQGEGGDCFFQKHHNASVPEQLAVTAICEARGERRDAIVSSDQRCPRLGRRHSDRFAGTTYLGVKGGQARAPGAHRL